MERKNRGKFPHTAKKQPFDVSAVPGAVSTNPAPRRKTITLSYLTYNRLMSGAQYGETCESRILGLLDKTLDPDKM